MNKYKMIGTLIALLLLIASLILKFGPFGEATAKFALPLLCAGAWVIAAFDTKAYRSSEVNAIQKRVEFKRLVALYIVSALISVGTVIFLVSGK